ncbi:putative receptor protein kinase ZmPK1 [Hordeum vulgare]|nr:putative receptor protein kinase ZmPK1 [Hordeum vulgare]
MPINAKVHVYSYEVVLLEIVIGTTVSSGIIANERQMEFPDFIQEAKQILATENINDLVDARLKGQFDLEQASAMVRIAVSCLGDRSKRPTMDEVLKSLMSYDDEDDHPAYSY